VDTLTPLDLGDEPRRCPTHAICHWRRQHVLGHPQRRPRLQAATEFLKEGLHAIGQWWLENPGPSRDELVDVVMRIVWGGLQERRRRDATKE
jgi:hypothetical protein